jgi:hypothetical protein
VTAERMRNLAQRLTVSRVRSFPAFCIRCVPIGAVERHLDDFLALSTRLAALLLAAVVARFVGSAARLPTRLRFTCVHVAASLALVAAVASQIALKCAATRWALQTQGAGLGIVLRRQAQFVRLRFNFGAAERFVLCGTKSGGSRRLRCGTLSFHCLVNQNTRDVRVIARSNLGPRGPNRCGNRADVLEHFLAHAR